MWSLILEGCYSFQAMGIHMHGVDRPATPQEILSKVILVVGAIYAFFLFERLMIVCLGKAPLTRPVQSMNKLGVRVSVIQSTFLTLWTTFVEIFIQFHKHG